MISKSEFEGRTDHFEYPKRAGDYVRVEGSLSIGNPKTSVVSINTDGGIAAYLELSQVQELITDLMERAVFLANFIEENTSKF